MEFTATRGQWQAQPVTAPGWGRCAGGLARESPERIVAMKKLIPLLALLAWLGVAGGPAQAEVTLLIGHEGRMAVRGANYDGPGQFKFALLSADGNVAYWSNDGSANSVLPPSCAVPLMVSNGVYSTRLGDTTVPNMARIPTSVFLNTDVQLRVWFNDGTNGFERLYPDQLIEATASQAASTPGVTNGIAASQFRPQASGRVASSNVYEIILVSAEQFSPAGAGGLPLPAAMKVKGESE